MHAETYQLKQILNPERRYLVPTFQRDYEWTKDGQWELLFDDLESVATRLLDARRRAEAAGLAPATADKSVSPHFLGAIVCDQLPSAAGGLDLRAVIDGQQRLTTLELLVRGVLDVLVERESARAKQVRRLLFNPDDVVQEPNERFKLWPRRKDRLAWPTAMDDETPSKNGHRYVAARLYFGERVRNAVAAQCPDERTEYVETLVDALLDLFRIVAIDLDENDDPQVIFEVLNGRQTPLSASDLVKNLLFLRAELMDEGELETLYSLYWAEFDDEWWKVDVGSGHAARGRRDVVLSVWLTAATCAEASVAHLYGNVRTYLDASGRKTEDVLEELHRYAHAYKAIYGEEPAGSQALEQSYSHITRLKVLTAVPLLAWLRTLQESQLTPAQHEAAVASAESWIVRRMLVGGNTRGYGSAIVTVLKRAQASVQAGGASIVSEIARAFAEAPNQLAWPTDTEVANAFTADAYYGRFTQDRIRLLLGAVDARLRAENVKTEPATFDYEALQIEHVLPQGWREHWQLNITGVEWELAAARRDRALHRIGNLTLVTSSFNQGVSNKAWTIKREELANQSALRLNPPIAAIDVWDEAEIDARALALAAVVCGIWSRPV